jgi:hypothetical protein
MSAPVSTTSQQSPENQEAHLSKSSGRQGAVTNALLNCRGDTMATQAYKILLFMKRRPGMSFDDFQDYYENRHVPLCEKYLSGVTRYLRRFLAPHTNPETGTDDELAFDVITELWFEDESIFRGTVQYLTTNILPEEVVSDEKQLFDRGKTRMATVMECESDLTR